MRLDCSCHCKAVRFSVESPHPYPFNLCYCEGCRKTAGTGGYAINLSGRAETLEVEGEDAITVYRPGHNSQERRFCSRCGTALWIQDPRWPELMHPYASVVDTPLPTPPERTHLMLEFKAPWVEVRADAQDRHADGYPAESIAAWHARLGLVSDSPPAG